MVAGLAFSNPDDMYKQLRTWSTELSKKDYVEHFHEALGEVNRVVERYDVLRDNFLINMFTVGKDTLGADFSKVRRKNKHIWSMAEQAVRTAAKNRKSTQSATVRIINKWGESKAGPFLEFNEAQGWRGATSRLAKCCEDYDEAMEFLVHALVFRLQRVGRGKSRYLDPSITDIQKAIQFYKEDPNRAPVSNKILTDLGVQRNRMGLLSPGVQTSEPAITGPEFGWSSSPLMTPLPAIGDLSDAKTGSEEDTESEYEVQRVEEELQSEQELQSQQELQSEQELQFEQVQSEQEIESEQELQSKQVQSEQELELQQENESDEEMLLQEGSDSDEEMPLQEENQPEEVRLSRNQRSEETQEHSHTKSQRKKRIREKAPVLPKTRSSTDMPTDQERAEEPGDNEQSLDIQNTEVEDDVATELITGIPSGSRIQNEEFVRKLRIVKDLLERLEVPEGNAGRVLAERQLRGCQILDWWHHEYIGNVTLADCAILELQRFEHHYPDQLSSFQFSLFHQLAECDPVLWLLQTIFSSKRELYALPQGVEVIPNPDGSNRAAATPAVCGGVTSATLIPVETAKKGLTVIYRPTLLSASTIITLTPGTMKSEIDVFFGLRKVRSERRPVPLDIRDMSARSVKFTEMSPILSEISPLSAAILGQRAYTEDEVKAEMDILLGEDRDRAWEWILEWRVTATSYIQMKYRLFMEIEEAKFGNQGFVF
jgi:hypothetical protein